MDPRDPMDKDAVLTIGHTITQDSTPRLEDTLQLASPRCLVATLGDQDSMEDVAADADADAVGGEDGTSNHKCHLWDLSATVLHNAHHTAHPDSGDT